MKILSIETSCDETGISLIEAKGGLKNPQFKILKSVISSQIKTHRPFGGVVPNLAKREHLKNLPILFEKITKNYKLSTINLVAVTVGPGLEPALWTGITFAKQICADLRGLKRGFTRKRNIEIVGVNHLEGHLYSFLLPQKTVNPKSEFLSLREIWRSQIISKLFPAVALIVSGGHTILLLMENLTRYKKLGETLDDAAGEAFDKVARLLSFPYPGGPEIEKIAIKGNPKAVNFPRPMIYDKTYNFSFSGLKTSVLYYLRDQHKTRINTDLNADKRGLNISENQRNNPRKSADAADVAASFQQAVIDVLVSKTIKAAEKYQAKSVFLSGGVASNKALRESLKKKAKKFGMNFLAPDFQFNTDNAAMIGAAAYINFLKKKKHKIIAQGNLSL